MQENGRGNGVSARLRARRQARAPRIATIGPCHDESLLPGSELLPRLAWGWMRCGRGCAPGSRLWGRSSRSMRRDSARRWGRRSGTSRGRDFVPKSYRKAVKVMARDTELAVAAAQCATEDAGMVTQGSGAHTDDGAALTYAPDRVGCQIGAGLIAAEVPELAMAMATATEDGEFSYARWGTDDETGAGMDNLTPLWMLQVPAEHARVPRDDHPRCARAFEHDHLLRGVGALEHRRVSARDRAGRCGCLFLGRCGIQAEPDGAAAPGPDGRLGAHEAGG